MDGRFIHLQCKNWMPVTISIIEIMESKTHKIRFVEDLRHENMNLHYKSRKAATIIPARTEGKKVRGPLPPTEPADMQPVTAMNELKYFYEQISILTCLHPPVANQSSSMV